MEQTQISNKRQIPSFQTNTNPFISFQRPSQQNLIKINQKPSFTQIEQKNLKYDSTPKEGIRQILLNNDSQSKEPHKYLITQQFQNNIMSSSSNSQSNNKNNTQSDSIDYNMEQKLKDKQNMKLCNELEEDSLSENNTSSNSSSETNNNSSHLELEQIMLLRNNLLSSSLHYFHVTPSSPQINYQNNYSTPSNFSQNNLHTNTTTNNNYSNHNNNNNNKNNNHIYNNKCNSNQFNKTTTSTTLSNPKQSIYNALQQKDIFTTPKKKSQKESCFQDCQSISSIIISQEFDEGINEINYQSHKEHQQQSQQSNYIHNLQQEEHEEELEHEENQDKESLYFIKSCSKQQQYNPCYNNNNNQQKQIIGTNNNNNIQSFSKIGKGMTKTTMNTINNISTMTTINPNLNMSPLCTYFQKRNSKQPLVPLYLNLN